MLTLAQAEMPWWQHVSGMYYVVILVLIGGSVGIFMFLKKKSQAAQDAKRPPQRGIIK